MAHQQLLVPGHTLVQEGYAQDRRNTACARDDLNEYGKCWHGKCSCGALSPEGLSRHKNQAWHRRHKEYVRDHRPPVLRAGKQDHGMRLVYAHDYDDVARILGEDVRAHAVTVYGPWFLHHRLNALVLTDTEMP